MKTYSRKKAQKHILQEGLLNFNETCRLCLLSTTQRLPIFNDYDTTIPSKINTCTGIEVYENDGFPPNICLSCQKILDSSFTFRQKSQESHTKLCHIINTFASMGIETTSEVVDVHPSNISVVKNDSIENSEEVSNPYLSTTESEISVTATEILEQEKNNDRQEFITGDPYSELPSDGVKTLNNITTDDSSSTSNNRNNRCAMLDFPGTSKDLPEMHVSDEISGEEVYSINIGVENEDTRSDTFNISMEDSDEMVFPDANSDDIVNSKNRPIKKPTVIRLFISDASKNTSDSPEKTTNSLGNETNVNKSGQEIKKKLLFKCIWCSVKFSDKSAFDKHVAEHKNGKPKRENLACGVCDRVFKTHLAFTRHGKTHANLDTFTCKICNKLFDKYAILNRHYVSHSNERPFSCKICGKSYTQREGLRSHTTVAHPDDPEEITLHECPLCEKSFCHPSGLSRHIVLHTGKTYNCLSCPKKFTDSSSLKRHARSKNHKY